jgi:hypothetical protein
VQSLEYSKQRLRAFLEEIRRLKTSEFPYVHSANALQLIEQKFSLYLGHLEKLKPNSDRATIRAACAAELSGLWEYLPILGFVLRSTNPRNAFEIHGPLLRLARELVKPSVKLIFSSEWDYSPFTFLGVPHLPDYVLIGSPAHEAENPLLLPLAGHELGHSVWASRDLSSTFGGSIHQLVLSQIKKRWKEYHALFPDVSDPTVLESDIFAQQTWSPAVDWGTRQAEESFCDFVGLSIFGESYLHAFAYLLAPKYIGVRSVLYPNLIRRVENLIKAATSYKIPIPKDYKEEFDDLPAPGAFDRQQVFLLSLADTASESLIQNLVVEAGAITTSVVTHPYHESEIARIIGDFKSVAPASNAGCLANLLNAGWQCYHDKNLWKEIPQIREKDRTLKELILKSIEVFEYEQLLKVPL